MSVFYYKGVETSKCNSIISDFEMKENAEVIRLAEGSESYGVIIKKGDAPSDKVFTGKAAVLGMYEKLKEDNKAWRPARARVPGAARPDVPLGLGAPGRAHGPARGGAAAGLAGPPPRPVPVAPLAREARPAAPGARARPPARPAGPVGHLRAQRPREPPPLAVRPAPSPLAVSCQASRVSPRHVFSLTASWRRRGASSCRRRSNHSFPHH